MPKERFVMEFEGQIDNGIAAEILSRESVDRSFDGRPAGDVLRFLVQKGALPGALLQEAVKLEPVHADTVAIDV
jgi:hypothetical protein